MEDWFDQKLKIGVGLGVFLYKARLCLLVCIIQHFVKTTHIQLFLSSIWRTFDQELLNYDLQVGSDRSRFCRPAGSRVVLAGQSLSHEPEHARERTQVLHAALRLPPGGGETLVLAPPSSDWHVCERVEGGLGGGGAV